MPPPTKNGGGGGTTVNGGTGTRNGGGEGEEEDESASVSMHDSQVDPDVLEDARIQWEHVLKKPINDFSMKEFLKEIEKGAPKDDDEAEEDSSPLKRKKKAKYNMFDNNLSEKEFIIWEKREKSIVRMLEKGAEEVAKVLGGELKDVALDVLQMALPPHIKARRRKKAMIAKLTQHDQDIEGFVGGLIQAELKQKETIKKEKHLHKKRKRILAHDEPTKEFMDNLVNAELEAKREQELADFKERRAALLKARESSKEDIAAKIYAETEAENDRIRKWRLKHWKKKAVDLRIEAQDLRDDYLVRKATQLIEDNEKDDVFQAEREKDRFEDQILGPDFSSDTRVLTKSLGVFGTPLDEGEFHGVKDGGKKDGIDDTEVQLFSMKHEVSYEKDIYQFQLSLAEQDKVETLYDSLEDEKTRTDHQVDNMNNIKDRVMVELGQLESEHLWMEKRHEGPPRADPTNIDKESTHFRKARKIQLQKKLKDLDHEIEKIHERDQQLQVQIVKAAQDVASIREKNKKWTEKREATNLSGGMELPVVVGTSIADLKEIGKFKGKPEKAYQQTVHESRIEVMKLTGKTALKARKEAKHFAHKVWINTEHKKREKVHLDELVNALVHAKESVRQVKDDNRRLDLIGAIKLFFSRRQALNKIITEHKENIEWWKNRYHDKNCVQFWSSREIRDREEIKVLEEMKKKEDEKRRADKLKEEKEREEREAAQKEKEEKEKARAEMTELEREKHDLKEQALALKAKDDAMKAERERIAAGEESSDEEESEEQQMNENPYFQAISLGPAYAGSVKGSIKMPIRDLWSIQFFVTKRDPYADDQGNPLDSVTIRVGPAPKQLTMIAQIKNEANEYTDAYEHEVISTITAQEIHWEIVFSSASLDDTNNMVVEVGEVRTHTIAPIQETFFPDGSIRVLSSLVELIRMESSKPKIRFSKMLEDLVEAEDSKNMKYWDSMVYFFYPQRFPRRKYFMKLMKKLLKRNVEGEVVETANLNLSRKQMMKLTPEEKKKLRMLKSQNEYLKRKKEDLHDKVEDAQTILGMDMQLFNIKEQKWVMYSIEDVTVRWIENGTKVKIFHRCQRKDEWLRNVGNPKDFELEWERFYVTEKKVRDEAAFKLFMKNEAKRAKMKELEKKDKQRQKEEDERVEFELEQAKRKRDLERLEFREGLKVTGAKEAKQLLKTKTIRKQLATQVRISKEEIKLGLRHPQGKKPCFVSHKMARKEAYDRWTEEYIQKRLENFEEQCRLEDEATEEEKEAQIREKERLIKKNLIRNQKLRKKMDEDLEKVKAKKRNAARAKLTIKDFHKAVKQAPKDFCEHERTKAWGDCYGKGVRCLVCGAEITTTHQNGDQKAGIGTGEDPAFVEKVNLHRINSPAYRFKNAKELADVEEERRRLEKERRIMHEEEVVFFDLQNIKGIYNFDRRHKSELKDKGIMRQGVQWTQLELDKWKERKREEFECLSPLTKMDRRNAFESLLEGAGETPEFRQYDLCRQSNFQDLILSIGRVNAFRQRLSELKAQRVMLVEESESRGIQIEWLHKRMIVLDGHMIEVETDLGKVSAALDIQDKANKEFFTAKEMKKTAEKQKKIIEMEAVGVEEDAEEAYEYFEEKSRELKHLLRMKVLTIRLKFEVSQLLEKSSKEVAALKTRMFNASELVAVMKYRMRGQMIQTQFGMSEVQTYREEDNMIIVNIDSVGRLYMKAEICLYMDRAVEQATQLRMETEEKETKVFIQAETKIRNETQFAMEIEERELREYNTFVDTIHEEELYLARAINNSVKIAKEAAKSQDIKDYLKNRTRDEIERRLKEREAQIRNYKGEDKKKGPKMYKWWHIRKMRKEIKKKYKTEFIKIQIDLAIMTSKMTVENRRIARAEEATLAFVLNQWLHPLIYQVAKESITCGIEAKRRSEGLCGVIFMDPAHMQFPVYNLMKNWWLFKKESLTQKLKILEVKCAKYQEKLKKQQEKENAMKQSIELLEEKEKMKAKIERLCAKMEFEELVCRKFYKEELKLNLIERRGMFFEETTMKMYLKEQEMLRQMEEKMMKAAAASSFGVEGGVTQNEKKRMDLKRRNVERGKLKKENEMMAAEDKLASEIRAEEKKQEAMAKIKAEMEAMQMNNEEEEEEESDDSDSALEDGKLTKKQLAARALAEGKSVEQIKAELKEKKQQIKDRQRKYRRKARAAKRAQQQEERAALQWMTAFQESLVDSTKTELAWMKEEEDRRTYDKTYREANENERKLEIFCQRKSLEHAAAHNESKKSTRIAVEKLKARDESIFWVDKVNELEHRRRKFRQRVLQDTRMFDTKSINMSWQRLETKMLYGQLYHEYFTTLVLWVAMRAELIANERRLHRIMDLLFLNLQEATYKTKKLTAIQNGIRRKQFMQLKRSELCKKMFTTSRKHIIKAVFHGWAKFMLWHKNLASAYTLKYQLIKQKKDIGRLYPEIEDAGERGEHGLACGGSENIPELKRTLIHRHNQRVRECRNCHQFYLETQNHDLSCPYHPGKYMVACPRACKEFSTKCMAHRMKRWTCCDVRAEGIYMQNGCKYKRHMPPYQDDHYDAKLKELDAGNKKEEAALIAELQYVKLADWPTKARKAKMNQLKKMTDHMDNERALVEKFKNMKME